MSYFLPAQSDVCKMRSLMVGSPLQSQTKDTQSWGELAVVAQTLVAELTMRQEQI